MVTYAELRALEQRYVELRERLRRELDARDREIAELREQIDRLMAVVDAVLGPPLDDQDRPRYDA